MAMENRPVDPGSIQGSFNHSHGRTHSRRFSTFYKTTTKIPRPDDVGAGGKWEKGDVGSGHLGIPTAVNEAVTIRNLDKN